MNGPLLGVSSIDDWPRIVSLNLIPRIHSLTTSYLSGLSVQQRNLREPVSVEEMTKTRRVKTCEARWKKNLSYNTESTLPLTADGKELGRNSALVTHKWHAEAQYIIHKYNQSEGYTPF